MTPELGSNLNMDWWFSWTNLRNLSERKMNEKHSPWIWTTRLNLHKLRKPCLATGLIKILRLQSCYFTNMNEMEYNSVQICKPPKPPSTSPITHTHPDIHGNLSLTTSMQLPPHQIISYICHPTDVRAPAASYILFMTILIICLCADLSVTVAPLLHIVRITQRTIHHLLYYYELCISLVYAAVHACVVSHLDVRTMAEES